jgi:L-lactate dehydrogenase complex protein LldG
MEKMATTANWRVRRAVGKEEAIAQIAAVVEEVGASKVALTDHPVLRNLSLADILRQDGVDVVLATTAEFDSRAAMHDAVNQCQLGITGVDYALAETGSCILLPRQGVSRVVSLLPEHHLAVVDASQIVENFEELMALRRSSFLEDGTLRSYMSIVTGPSRTGDIEQTIVIGAHGPRQVHMIIVDYPMG